MPLPGLVGMMPEQLSARISSGAIITAAGGNGALTYGSTTVSASGGAPNYSYDWEYVSGDSEISAASDSSATTAWTSIGVNTVFDAEWRCKVTDAGGVVAYSGNVSIQVTHGTPPP